MPSRDLIPLFPLEQVLFPKMVMPLHIFEERYKEMIHLCMNSEESFGVVHSDIDLRGAIGTTAQVFKLLRTHDDGSMDILTLGGRRFQVLQTYEDQEYLRAEVEYFPEETPVLMAQESITRLLTLYHSFIARMGLEPDQKSQLRELVDELEEERELSYIIGQTIGLDINGQLELLAKTSANERVGLLLANLHQQDQMHALARKLFEESDFDPTSN